MDKLDSNEQPLSALIGCELSSIEFVQDYIQFRFGGPCLTAYNHPVLEIDENCYYWGFQEYCFLLCQQIGKTILNAFVIEDEAVYLELDTPARLCISLRAEDYIIPEGVMFINGKDWWLW